MGLQEAVEVVPDPWDPVDDPNQLRAARPAADLRLDQLPPEVAAEEALHRLRVIGAEHPPDRQARGYVRGKTSSDTRKKKKKPSRRDGGRRVGVVSSPEVVVKLEVGSG